MEAAQASTWVQTTRIEVGDDTDGSGAAPYDQSLALRRAQAVPAGLVRLSVARDAISMHGFGADDPQA